MARFVAVSLALVLCFAGAVAAQDQPKAKPEILPPPRPVTGAVVPTPVLPYYLPNSLPKPGTREIWQFYGVDQTGQWRPRVILSPLGAYYLYNGEPFYFTTTRPEIFMPYALD